MIFNNKRGIELDMLGWILIGLLTLIILFIGIMVLSEKGLDSIDFIKGIFKLR